jgi:hypothetical protein
MVKNSHLREGGGLSSTSGMSALVLVLHSQKGNNPRIIHAFTSPGSTLENFQPVYSNPLSTI